MIHGEVALAQCFTLEEHKALESDSEVSSRLMMMSKIDVQERERGESS